MGLSSWLANAKSRRKQQGTLHTEGFFGDQSCTNGISVIGKERQKWHKYGKSMIKTEVMTTN